VRAAADKEKKSSIFRGKDYGQNPIDPAPLYQGPAQFLGRDQAHVDFIIFAVWDN